MPFARTDRSVIAEWWFTVDRTLLAIFLALIAAGLVVNAAASPAVAVRKGLDAFHFVERQMLFAVAGVLVMLVVSMLGAATLRRLALVMFVGGIATMVWVLLAGDEINGARRWVRLAGLSLQPSELVKPAFVVLSAWAFAEAARRPEMPGLAITTVSYAVFAVLLVLQPDVGQTALVTLVWGVLLVLSGQRLRWAVALAALGIAGFAVAYLSLGYVRMRVARFLNPTPGDNSQIDRALQSFADGGLLGRGPGEGTIKSVLPDAHTDFIFAVLAEEYGLVACMALLALFAMATFRPLLASARDPDGFRRLAVGGLSAMIAAQALINMAVNVGLLPAKGMTLPFISSGGTSTIAMAFAAGVVLASTRRRPGLLVAERRGAIPAGSRPVS